MIQNPIIAGKNLPELTNPAGAANILKGYQAVTQDGELITGTMPKQSAGNRAIYPGESLSYAYGYYQDFQIDCPTLDNFTPATAAAADIANGKTAWVNGEKLTGTMANNGDVSGTIDGLTAVSKTIPAGYTSGGTVSLTSDIETALAAL